MDIENAKSNYCFALTIEPVTRRTNCYVQCDETLSPGYLLHIMARNGESVLKRP